MTDELRGLREATRSGRLKRMCVFRRLHVLADIFMCQLATLHAAKRAPHLRRERTALASCGEMPR